MTSSSASPLGRRIDRLLRSLVGVADVHLTFGSDGRLCTVAVLRDGGIPEHQLVRNVVSGLKAGLGLRVDAENVQVALHVTAWPHPVSRSESSPADAVEQTALPAHEAAPDRPAAPHLNGAAQYAIRHTPGSAQTGALRSTANGVAGAAVNGVANGNGRAHAPLPAHRPAERESVPLPAAQNEQTFRAAEPQLELIDVERQGSTLRCRVALRVADRVFSAIAEVRDAPSAEAELAARVTLDALRAGGLTTARLDGVTLATIADSVFVVASVRQTTTSAPRAGAAPLLRSMASAAAAAVLQAHGPVASPEPRVARTGTL